MGIEERRQDRIIDGVTYSTVPMAAGKGLRVLDRFKNVIAPLLSSALIAKQGLEAAAAEAMKALPSSLSSEDVEFFQKAFGETSIYVDGVKRVPLTPEIQDLHFAGRYMQLFDWLTFCMEVNFAGFFGELKKRAGAALESAKTKATLISAPMTGLSAA